jgi:hypothetical protein
MREKEYKKTLIPEISAGTRVNSCGATRLDAFLHPLFAYKHMLRRITGAIPVGYYSLTLSAALRRPFTLIPPTAFSAPAALFVALLKLILFIIGFDHYSKQ